MNDLDFTLPPSLTESLDSFYAAQSPDPQFAADLEKKLLQRQTESNEASNHKHLYFGDSMRKIKLTFRTRPVLAILAALLALMILSGIVYAVAQLAAFIPGVGFVNDVQSVMETPASEENPLVSSATAEPGTSEIDAANDLPSQTRNGIILTVEQAVADVDQLVIVYKVTGLPVNYFGMRNNSTSSSGQLDEPLPDQVRLPDDSILRFQDGSGCSGAGGGDGSWLSCRDIFSPLPVGVMELTLEIDRLNNALPGELPENWQIPIHMAPATASSAASGVQELDLRSQTIHGLTLQLLKVSQGASQTAFQLSMLSDFHDRYVHHMAQLKLQDEQGRYYIISGGPDAGHDVIDDPHTFIFGSMYTTPVEIKSPLTFSIDWMMLSVGSQAELIFYPGKDAMIGQEWPMDERFTVDEFDLHFTKARLKNGYNNDFMLEFDLEVTDGVTGVELMPEMTASSVETGYDTARGVMVSRVSFPSIPDRPVKIFVNQVLYKVVGPWKITWQPELIDFSGAPTVTPVPTRLAEALPTQSVADPILVKLQKALSFANYENLSGPGWIHEEWKVNQAASYGILNSGDTQERPLNYISDTWFYLDENGYVQKSIGITRSNDGRISSANITNGRYHFNIPDMFGSISDEIYLEKHSYDGNFLSTMSGYLFEGGTLRNEAVVVDGKPCQLFEATLPVNPPIVYVGEKAPVAKTVVSACVNPLNGQVIQSQHWYVYDNGELSAKNTSDFLLLEKVNTLPKDVQQLLDSVVMP